MESFGRGGRGQKQYGGFHVGAGEFHQSRGGRGMGGGQYISGGRGMGGYHQQNSHHMHYQNPMMMVGGPSGHRGGGGNFYEHRGGRGGGMRDQQQFRTTNYQRPPPGNVPYQTSRFKEEDQVAVKIRGLPYQVRYEEIADFFRDHRYIEKSAILGVGADGRKNGFGSILFEDQEEATKATKDCDGNYIGERYVEISVISYGDYMRFNGPTGGGFNNGQTIKLSKYVGPDNQERSLVMRGLPYKIQNAEIVKFFDGHGGVTDACVFVEEFNGKRTGSALVIFDNEENAKTAKEKFHKKEIGTEGRYVELYDQNDQFMKKICNLFTESDYM